MRVWRSFKFVKACGRKRELSKSMVGRVGKQRCGIREGLRKTRSGIVIRLLLWGSNALERGLINQL